MISLMFPTRARSSLARGEKGCRLLEDLLEIMRVVCSQPALFMRFLKLRELESCSEVRWRYHCGCVKMTGCASQRVQKDLIITVGGRGLQDTARHSSENFLLRDDKGSFSHLCTGKDMHNWKIQELL